MNLTLGLTYDLRSEYLAQGWSEEEAAEFDSDETLDLLECAIRSLGYGTDRIGTAKVLCRRLAAGDRWPLVFNIAEGASGRSREAQVPCLLEVFDIPYTFSDPLVCAATLDKAVAKRLVAAAGLPTPRFAVIEDSDDVNGLSLNFPLFAKPLCEGTGKGVDGQSRLDGPKDAQRVCRRLLERFRQPVLVEEFLPGREFTTGVLGCGRAARVIGTMEVSVHDPNARGIYSFTAKENCERVVRYERAAEDALLPRVEALALAAYRALECRDAARVDIRLDAAGAPSFIEVNPLPGLHPTHSDLPMIARNAGMTYEQLIGAIIESALARTRSAPCSAPKPQES